MQKRSERRKTMETKRGINRNKLNLFLDIALALAFVVVMEVGFTGQRYYEYLGVGIAVVFIIHIALHWRWIVQVSKQIVHHLLQPAVS
jgi:ABC-type sugar transport system permease subunit